MPDPLPFPQSLCHACRHLSLIASATTTFLRCRKPDWPKYAPQPVRRCLGFEPKGDAGDGDRRDDSDAQP